jgi:[acyl-carrier-protein] S-malonyltransferase
MMSRYGSYPVVRETFAEASAVLGQDLWALVEDGDGEALNQTVNTQPLMLAADVAVYRAWRGGGGRAPGVLAGHSLGEYAALVAAGSLAFADALPLVRFRAQAMQEAAAVEDACRQAAQGQVVEPVNLNAPDQTVIAGHREAVERASATAKAAGAKRVLMLPVSAPFHCLLMKPAAERLAAYLAKLVIDPAVVPVLHNADAREARTPDAIRVALAAQAASPVRWVETIRLFAARGVTHVVECGPGKVLTGLIKRIAPELAALPLSDGDALAAAIAETT